MGGTLEGSRISVFAPPLVSAFCGGPVTTFCVPVVGGRMRGDGSGGTAACTAPCVPVPIWVFLSSGGTESPPRL